jgi:hypothetical protein
LLGSDLHRDPPAVITFNYDLVFERALWEYFHWVPNHPLKPVVCSCKIRYYVEPYDFVIKGSPSMNAPLPFFRAEFQYNHEDEVEIPYLKLHGSLNWCSRLMASMMPRAGEKLLPAGRLTQVVESPLILPPVFNKMNAGDVSAVWQKALELLRGAKYIIIVEYSLPKTDSYMQYFLKSAVGPNSNLQWIKVFDPVLFRKDASVLLSTTKHRSTERCFLVRLLGGKQGRRQDRGSENPIGMALLSVRDLVRLKRVLGSGRCELGKTRNRNERGIANAVVD